MKEKSVFVALVEDGITDITGGVSLTMGTGNTPTGSCKEKGNWTIFTLTRTTHYWDGRPRMKKSK